MEKKSGDLQKKANQELVDIVARTEEETHPVFDLFWFYSRLRDLKSYTPSKVGPSPTL